MLSASAFLGSGAAKLYAQEVHKTDSLHHICQNYKEVFLAASDASHPQVEVEFVVDSIQDKLKNGDLLPDINVIEILADINATDNDSLNRFYQRYVAAHEFWHRLAIAKGVLQQPTSATLYRTGRDNFEISAGIVQLLTFRQDYLAASEDERKQMAKLNDAKIRMYLQAVKFGVINPFSDSQQDFDLEMAFIARMTATFWRKNMAPVYAPVHNQMTKSTGRKDFDAPVYFDNFNNDIKTLNTIGGIDFSTLYDYQKLSYAGVFDKGVEEDTLVLAQDLNAPNYRLWEDSISRLQRFSYQRVLLPNFNSPLLAEERLHKTPDGKPPLYHLAEKTDGYKFYPFAQQPFYTAATFANDEEIIKLYPNGCLDKILPEDKNGRAEITTFNYDGSYETGLLQDGRKHGEFIYFDNHNREISRCVFDDGLALDGALVMATDTAYIRYVYKDGEMTDILTEYKNEQPADSCSIKNNAPTDGTLPLPSFDYFQPFLTFQNGFLNKTSLFTADGGLFQQNVWTGDKLFTEKFYPDGKLQYRRIETLSDTQGNSCRQQMLFSPQQQIVAVQTDTHLKIKFNGFMQTLLALKVPAKDIQALKQAVRPLLSAGKKKKQPTLPAFPSKEMLLPEETLVVSQRRKRSNRGK